MAIKTFSKQVGEKILVETPFKKKMSKTETISSIDDIVVTPAGPVISNQAIVGQTTTVLFAGGLDLNNYKLTTTITTDVGQILEEEVQINVKDI